MQRCMLQVAAALACPFSRDTITCFKCRGSRSQGSSLQESRYRSKYRATTAATTWRPATGPGSSRRRLTLRQRPTDACPSDSATSDDRDVTATPWQPSRVYGKARLRKGCTVLHCVRRERWQAGGNITRIEASPRRATTCGEQLPLSMT